MKLVCNPKIKSIIEVTISNIMSVASGVVVGLLLPRILPIEDYGWFKTFSLYATYVGFCSLGLIDGIVLRHGGDDYQDLNRYLFRGYFKVYAGINGVFVLILLLLSCVFHDKNYSYILLMLSLYLFAVNISGYFQQISQITQRFKEYSLRKIIYSGLKIIIVGILFLGELLGVTPNYYIFLIYFVLSEYILTIWYIFTYRDIVKGKSEKIQNIKKDILYLIKIGFPLLFANLCSTLILSLDRQFVSVLFDKETYAVYAFAYNMLALVTVAMSAISTVLYPTLKRTTEETMKKNFSNLVSIISMMVFATIVLYFPLCNVVKWFLPKYIDSLPIFRIVFPGLAISSSITVVMHNYYKTLGKNQIYFKKSILVLIISALANGIAYVVFRTPSAISIASIVTMIIWYILAEQFFVNNYSYERKRNIFYIMSMMITFYLVTSLDNYFLGFLLYVILFILLSLLFHNQVIRKELPQILKRK